MPRFHSYSDVTYSHLNCYLNLQLQRTQLFVMTMNSSSTNPVLPCNQERAHLDFGAIVGEIVAQQEAVKKYIKQEVRVRGRDYDSNRKR